MTTISYDEWILDLSCLVHICSGREYFNEFQKKNISFMSLCDGSRCDITGDRMVKIKMFDEVTCTLGVVIYVLKM